jgi:tungstate transport system substrate-binding protein
MKTEKILVGWLLVALLLSACSPAATPTPTATSAPAGGDATPTFEHTSGQVILATTTSTQDSGLLDVLVPLFEQQTGLTVKTVAVGSGAALKMGEQGNADVLLVHSPSAEQTYMDNGFGSSRELVMHNDFILVGPESDPAGVKGNPSIIDAMSKIAAASAIFISRGDDSGTHSLEKNIWKKASLTPAGEWYVESGQGMGATLKIASEKAGYTITDRATFLAQKANLQTKTLVEKDPLLLNIYHVITVNPEKHPVVNADGAKKFAEFMVSPDTQKLIGEFGVDKFGQPLFTPDAGKSEADLGI